jgi:hypothetical protein
VYPLSPTDLRGAVVRLDIQNINLLATPGLVTLALAGAVAVPSPAAADPTGIAVVEGLTGNPSGVEFMDYVRAGQVIRLGHHQTIVLSYMASCVRETITGGTVTVGTQRSEVQSGQVRRIEGHCYSGRMELTGEEAHVGGESFAAQRTDRVWVLQRFGLATSPLYQNQRDRRRPNTNW